MREGGGGRHLGDAPEGGNKMIIGTKTYLVFLYQCCTVFGQAGHGNWSVLSMLVLEHTAIC